MLKLAITKPIKRLACLLAVAALYGCGGSSSNTQSGVFVDSAVEGLRYRTDSMSGVTGPNGEFQYKAGEVVTFSIGDVVIGSTTGGELITPMHFGTAFVTSDYLTLNISRLLQSLDADGNLDNGIQITPEMHDVLKDRSINFNKATTDFEDSDITTLFADLNAKRVFKYAGQAKLRTALEARAHLNQTFGIKEDIWDTGVIVTQIDVPFTNFTSHMFPLDPINTIQQHTVFHRYTTTLLIQRPRLINYSGIRVIRPPTYARISTARPVRQINPAVYPVIRPVRVVAPSPR
jgi:hypothetical protein